jgi:hypothetical protein
MNVVVFKGINRSSKVEVVFKIITYWYDCRKEYIKLILAETKPEPIRICLISFSKNH